MGAALPLPVCSCACGAKSQHLCVNAMYFSDDVMVGYNIIAASICRVLRGTLEKGNIGSQY